MRMTQRAMLPTRAVILVGLAALPLVATAHHSWRAVYDGGEEVTIDATITSAVYRNPHRTVRAELVYDAEAPEEWTIEWRGGRRGDDESEDAYGLKPGDHVVIEGRIARFPGSKKLQMYKLTRLDDGLTITARRGRNRDRN